MNDKQCVIALDKSPYICEDNNLEIPKYSGKKLITFSPGGLKALYFMGIAAFIKEKYDLSNYIYSGASAGAWAALFTAYKYNSTELLDYLLISKDITDEKNIMNLEYRMKRYILNKYTVDDFHFDRLFISVTPIKFPISSNIYYKF
jgi:predicted acylesterase/phospholipase RssA